MRASLAKSGAAIVLIALKKSRAANAHGRLPGAAALARRWLVRTGGVSWRHGGVARRPAESDSAGSNRAVVRILALSGSLRAASLNSMLLRAMAQLASSRVEVALFGALGALPLFNPDLEAAPPASVVSFQRAVAEADALLIASPEYAHGVSGTIKNALDWLVGFTPFVAKRVAVLNASPRAHHADDALRETLRTMAAQIIEPASIDVPLLGARLDEAAILATPALATTLRGCLQAIEAEVLAQRAASSAPLGRTR